MSSNPVLVEAWRGGVVESRHRGACAVVDAQGRVLWSVGDIDHPVFPRSAVKLLQALPLVASGAADAFHLDDAALALACASHGGEEAHVRTARSVLQRAGLDEGALECGTHWPYFEPAARALAAAGRQPCPLHNNCSGKHAGFLCLGAHLAGGREPRGFVAGYVRRGHPLMREVEHALQTATGWDLATAPCGTDGCSIPTHAIPLRHLALAFARAGTGVGLPPELARAAQRLRAAIARHPFLVAGSERMDTQLMQALGERLCCKVGAEGMYCAALPEAGLGVALKIDDGAARAAEAALAALAQALLPLDDAAAAAVGDWNPRRLINWQGLEVGALRATEALRPADAAARRTPGSLPG
ncbi:asparaginase [Azohydromonas caseinilytica]|uniref:Asparaginase n=1 Tax=Azohydromonas caseinilytica TaxID=2728836 RepID=A0A848F9X6_9BURK|nr:asparaginase [Azohydromonas caseinilytica]NML14801.1 asparaginase [Azohydromonas caseinilytica]